MNNLVLGKYIPIDSAIHKLDPRGKIAVLFVMIVSIFVADSWYAYLGLGLIILFVVLLAHIKLSTK